MQRKKSQARTMTRLLTFATLTTAITTTIFSSLATAAAPTDSIMPKHQTSSAWYQTAKTRLQQQPFYDKPTPKAKNIIIFIGDGMGVSTVTAARILAGQQLGNAGEEHQLSFDKMPFTALSKTYNVDAQVSDSAGTMTAMMSGVKTNAGLIGLNEHAKRGDCQTQPGTELITTLEIAEIAGLATGIVTNTRITHATPAATYAKAADRNWESDSAMPAASIAAGCKDIASQLIYFEQNLKAHFPTATTVNGLEVALGGGRSHFLPESKKGKRLDNRDLISEWRKLYPDGQYIQDEAGLKKIKPQETQHLFGLFSDDHLRYEADRVRQQTSKDNQKSAQAQEPSLTVMTNKAIEVLSQNEKGYFLMVEAGRIDHSHHAGNAFNALNDTIEFANAIQAAIDTVDLSNTLVLVTADHSHVMSMAGYPRRGNPILGKVVNIGQTKPTLASDGLPYTTLSYANGLGFHDFGDQTNADVVELEKPNTHRQDLTKVDTTATGFHQEAHVPLKSETHGGEDVALYAQGAGAETVMGTLEQQVIFHIMNYAGQLEVKAAEVLRR